MHGNSDSASPLFAAPLVTAIDSCRWRRSPSVALVVLLTPCVDVIGRACRCRVGPATHLGACGPSDEPWDGPGSFTALTPVGHAAWFDLLSISPRRSMPPLTPRCGRARPNHDNQQADIRPGDRFGYISSVMETNVGRALAPRLACIRNEGHGVGGPPSPGLKARRLTNVGRG